MQWLASRQKIIAQNLSNVDTPDYHAQDLVPFHKAIQTSRLAQSRTNEQHIGYAPHKDFPVRKDSAPDVSISNNAVSIEQELIKASEVAHAHTLMTNQYKKTMSLFRLAFGRRGGG